MDPFGTALVTSVVSSGTAFALTKIEKALKAGVPKAVDKALSEQRDLIRILDERISRLQDEERNRLTRSFERPDTLYSIQKALKTAALLDDDLKRTVLHETIWAKISHNDDSINHTEGLILDTLEFLNKEDLVFLHFQNLCERTTKKDIFNPLSSQIIDQWTDDSKNLPELIGHFEHFIIDVSAFLKDDYQRMIKWFRSNAFPNLEVLNHLVLVARRDYEVEPWVQDVTILENTINYLRNNVVDIVGSSQVHHRLDMASLNMKDKCVGYDPFTLSLFRHKNTGLGSTLANRVVGSLKKTDFQF